MLRLFEPRNDEGGGRLPHSRNDAVEPSHDSAGLLYSTALD
ncbi:hypothetical protein ACLMNI_000544 [Campylobacter upsaliensis]